MVKPVAGSIGVVSEPAFWLRHPVVFLIDAATDSRYDHTAIVTRVEGKGVYVTEAWWPKVRFRKLRRWEIKRWRFEADPRITPSQRAQIVRAANHHLGEGYDVLDLFRFVGWVLTGKRPERKPERRDRIICSELVARALFAAGVNPWPKVAFEAVSPADVAEWMSLR